MGWKMSKKVIKKNISSEENLSLAVVNKLRCNLFGNFAVVIEGHKGLKTFLLEKIIFKADKKQNVSIVGKNLSIKQLTLGYALVMGEISGIIYEEII